MWIWALLLAMCLAAITLTMVRKNYLRRCNLRVAPRFDVYFINMDEAPGRLARFMKRYKACDLYATHSPIRFQASPPRRCARSSRANGDSTAPSIMN